MPKYTKDKLIKALNHIDELACLQVEGISYREAEKHIINYKYLFNFFNNNKSCQKKSR